MILKSKGPQHMEFSGGFWALPEAHTKAPRSLSHGLLVYFYGRKTPIGQGLKTKDVLDAKPHSLGRKM